jgi:cell division protein FtsB
VTRRFVAVLPLLFAAACVTADPDALRTLADADARTAQGDFAAALLAYDTYLARYPNEDGASHVRVTRAVLQELLALRRERDRLAAREAELTRQVEQMRQVALARETTLARESAARDAEEAAAREASAREMEAAKQLAAREAELARLRQEVTQRQAEAARLREDLEALKRTDLEMERRRR